MFNRRSLLAGAAALALAVPVRALAQESMGRLKGARNLAMDAPADPAVRAGRIAWLEANAAPLRSIDMADDDFADLEPLRKAIGDARIVLLGEQSHGDGTAFVAKSRMVRFLHERMDFDVLAFESGLFNMPKVWNRIRAGEPARSAARQGLYQHWADSRQMSPLLNYIDDRARSSRPLELTGFDCKFSNYISASDAFADDLAAVLTASGVDTASMAAWPRFRNIIDKVAHGANFGQWKPSEDEQRFVLTIADELMARLATAQTADAAFWCQMLRSTKQYAESLSYVADPNTFIVLRDAAMGDNLNWLAREAFPRRKIIVWAANLHNMRNVRVLDPIVSKWRVMGDYVWDAFGDKIYSIGFTAHGGARAWHYEATETPIKPPMPDSIEDLWGATTHQNAFVDLRNVATGGEWLNSSTISHLFNGSPAIAEWNKLVDGVVFLRTMQRATRVG